jgi:hypothetical protein
MRLIAGWLGTKELDVMTGANGSDPNSKHRNDH